MRPGYFRNVVLARIAIDAGVAYVAWPDGGGELSVRLGGKMLRQARAGETLRPVVGDWVEVSPGGLVVEVKPRRTVLARKAAGLADVEQVMAANVDTAFVATSADGDVNERRLERYLAVIHDGGVEPVILLTKADACDDVERERERIRHAAPGVETIVVSGKTGLGVEEVAQRVGSGRLAALLGSSGVGKSTLVNRLLGEERHRVGDVRDDGKGRHTTTRREIARLPGGGLLLDMPGMRELGLIDAGQGVDDTFAEVSRAASRCRFRDCSHGTEPGCRVREGLESGELAAERVEGWRKLLGELLGRRKRSR
jgi:ribosome biogenesis GTPase / thiamine phosphate phosphatase